MKKILKACWIRDNLKSYDWIDLLGFNFIEISKRKISPEKAKSIKTNNILRIWLFWKYENWKWKNITKNYEKEIIQTALETNMNWLQIYWKFNYKKFKKQWFYIIKPIIFENVNKTKENPNIDLYIVETNTPWSWKTFDYENIKEIKIKKPYLIASGINEENLDFILKKFPNCHWVDIASWVDNWENISEEKVKKILKILKNN
jgi:phosphoribosylanthranilate isomerase